MTLAWNHCFFDVESLKITFNEKWRASSPFLDVPLDSLLWIGLWNIFNSLGPAGRESVKESILWFHKELEAAYDQLAAFFKVI